MMIDRSRLYLQRLVELLALVLHRRFLLMEVIRPLCLVTEAMTRKTADILKVPNVGCCDFEEDVDATGDRAFLENMIDELGSRFDNIRKHMLHSMGDVRLEHLLDLKYLSEESGGIGGMILAPSVTGKGGDD